MRRLPAASLAALLAALPALAQGEAEGGPIRTGEHGAFTRVVMTIDPSTEWSLESKPGEAVIFFPGRRLEFGLAGVFDRIPRTRVTGIAAQALADGTRVAVALACDCRITASFVGARYLALDVADRDAPEAAPVTAAHDVAPQESAAARELREAEAVEAAERSLMAQIARAADQGVIELARPHADAPPAPRPAAAEADVLEAAAKAADAAAGIGAVAQPPAAETPAELAMLDQVEAISVYDRDSAALAAARPAPPPPEVCIADADLDAGAWTMGAPLSQQTPALMRRAVGEFDRPDAEALRDLARLYVATGFGAEAEALAAGFGTEFPDRALLVDMGRAIEGRPVDPAGPLAVDAPCPGRHGLWLALGGAAPVFHDAGHFATVEDAFADMPVALRGLVAPLLAGRLLEAGRDAEAALVVATALRPGQPPSDALRIAAARVEAAQGRAREAAAALLPLAESGGPLATEALVALVRAALDAGLAIPERTIVDLEAAARIARGRPGEAALRGLIVEALAARGALPEAMAEAIAAGRALPADRARLAALGAAALAAAEPAAVGAAPYAEAALLGGALIPAGPAGDPARRRVAAGLVEVGLPNAAIAALAPALARGDPESLRLLARAELALGDPEAALAALGGLAGPEALTLRAAALARSGDPAAALALLAEAEAEAEARDYAWPSGDWLRARAAAPDAGRAAMAGFMAAQAGLADAPVPADGAELTPEAAFAAPLPPLAAPSLGSARRLIEAGAPIGGFIGDLLAEE